MNVQGQKRTLNEISTSYSPAQELANSLRSIGWMGADHEAVEFSQVLTREIQAFIKDFDWPSFKFKDTVSSAREIQTIGYITIAASSGLISRFYRSIKHTDLLSLTACGLLYGFERFLSFYDSSNHKEWRGAKPMEWALCFKNFPAMDTLHKYHVPLPPIYLAFFNVKEIEKFDFRHIQNHHFANGDCVWDAEFAHEVLRRPFPLNNLDGNGHSILHCAAYFADVPQEFIASTIQLGVKIDGEDCHNLTPLHLAASINNLSMVRKLRGFGSNLDSIDGFGSTPLMMAKTPEMTSLLLDEGAKHEIRDAHGRTALQLAMNETNPNAEIIRLLRLATQKSRL